MEWAQVLAIVLPIFFAIVIGIFYQNKRFEDIHKRFEDVNKRIDDLRDEVREIKVELRDLKTLVLLLIQRDYGLRTREEIEKAVPSEKREKDI